MLTKALGEAGGFFLLQGKQNGQDAQQVYPGLGQMFLDLD